LVKGEETTFHLRYALQNALYLSEDAQTFNWSIVIDEQDAPVDSSTARWLRSSTWPRWACCASA
jgi:hypothetical protein